MTTLSRKYRRRSSYLTTPLKRSREFRFLQAQIDLLRAHDVLLSKRIALLEGKLGLSGVQL